MKKIFTGLFVAACLAISVVSFANDTVANYSDYQLAEEYIATKFGNDMVGYDYTVDDEGWFTFHTTDTDGKQKVFGSSRAYIESYITH